MQFGQGEGMGVAGSTSSIFWYPDPCHSSGWITSPLYESDVIHPVLWCGSGYHKDLPAEFQIRNLAFESI